MNRPSRRPRPRSTSLVTTAVAVALATAGCAGGTTTGATAESTPTRADAISTDAAEPATMLVRVTGTVVPGEQPGCLLLDTGFTTYVLLGGDRAAVQEAEENEEEVTVTGQAHTPKPTKCTGGIPLAIEQFTPAT
ncbi:hypothetical protein [Actinophytocola sp. NPDC049390]|uniref:hypothetical protein n=1 Tax=Actinophytocola sp. NPDC049390 TaxID=3363894 RepID=UPI0037BD0F64